MIPLFYMILLPIVLAVLLYLFYDHLNKLFLFVIEFIILGLSCYFFYTTKTNGLIYETLGGYDLGVGITLKSDSISAVLILVNNFLFTCMVGFNYHKSYMNRLFLFLFILLQGLINGIFLANDMFTIYVLIELSVIVVSILIMFKKDSRSIYDGMIYLLTNIVAMTLYLLATAYMYKMFGTLDFDVLTERIRLIANPRTLLLPYSLIITAVGLKSAVMPLFSWLPRAHGTPSAPSIVSAILSGLYVKGGIYLFIRFQDMFRSQIQTNELFLLLGFLTAVIGFIFAISQTDIKLILAYSTVSQIGLIIFGLSLNHDYSFWGSIYHIVNHAVFKSVLFLTAGMIIEVYGTRDIRHMKGIFRRMPFVSIITIIAILGITGAPLFNGSISKYLIQHHTDTREYLEFGLLFINFGTILIFIRYLSCFFGKANHVPISSDHTHFRFNQFIVISIMAAICFFGGIFGVRFVRFLLNYDISISTDGYIRKALQYIVSILLGLGFYRYLYGRISYFKKVREFELTFNQIASTIIIFFTGIFTYLNIVVH